MTLQYAAALNSWSLVSRVTSWFGPTRLPFGRLMLVVASALRTSSRPMPRAASAAGLIWTRTAYGRWPKIRDSETPFTVDSFCAKIV